MLEYYEPHLDLSLSDEPNVMGIIVILHEPVDGEILQSVVDQPRVRFPYFYVRAARRGGDVVTVPNALPMTVRGTWEPISLNSEESNHHLATWKYSDKRLAFEILHALTDGAGALPYVKSALFLYLSKATGKTFDAAGFRLPGDAIPESETGDPFRGLDIDGAEAPLYRKKPIPDFFRLANGADSDKRVFYLRLPEEQVMTYCRSNDASPNVLFSVLLAKAARRYDPSSEKTITVFVAVNHKAILGNHDNYRLFVGNSVLDFPKSMDLDNVTRTCTMIHGQLILQTQPENSLWEIRQMKRVPPTQSTDVPQASICVSYPRVESFGPLDPYIDGLFVVTSLSRMTDVLCEVTCINRSFFLAFMQPFSSEEYLGCFLEELSLAGIPHEMLLSESLRLCKTQQLEANRGVEGDDASEQGPVPRLASAHADRPQAPSGERSEEEGRHALGSRVTSRLTACRRMGSENGRDKPEGKGFPY